MPGAGQGLHNIKVAEVDKTHKIFDNPGPQGLLPCMLSIRPSFSISVFKMNFLKLTWSR